MAEAAEPEGGWWRGACLYRIYPRSFQATGRSGHGDLAGLRQRLAYVASIGVDAVWLSPFAGFAEGNGAAPDVRRFDPVLGKPEEFDAVAAEARRLRLKLVVDVEPGEAAGEEAVLDGVRFWLERGADGIAIGQGGLRGRKPAFFRRLRALLDSYSERVAIAGRGAAGALHMALAPELLEATFLSPPLVRRAVGRAAGAACFALSGPEVARHATRLARAGGAEEPDRLATFSFSLLASLPGAIALYQGEELGLSDAGGAGGGLTPMVWDELGVYAGFSRARPWRPIPAPHRVRAVANEEYDPASVLAHYRNMLAFRRAHRALRTGDAAFVDMPGERLAFVRSDGGGRLLCLFNFGAEALRMPLPGAVRFLDAPGFGEPAVEAGKAIVLPPLAAAFGILA